ncbi:hypothetical protein [Lacticaseibacillus paracasei]|uniref:hypothetical protein n=1 Tax=Lacticaseibacillus paracasei TaxID=1597 RepID=UPI001F50A3DC|nr:hypothetical protein [Lacticaseibacillus paracasei]MCI0374710.1 hypothetical protein [Lacticaseibacillus paracasei]MCI0375741.1 hypothetical protein [Lacticaseibacillus paracasei]
MLNKIRNHPTHTALAIGMIAIGLFLIINDHYFIWPPNLTDSLNDDFVGSLYLFDGIAVGAWVLWESKSAKKNQVLLSVTAFLMAFLTILQFLTWAATGIYTSWISNLIITAVVLIVARRSDTRDGK